MSELTGAVLSERLTQVEAGIRRLETQRKENRDDATIDNDRRHGEVMGAVERVERRLEIMNGTVRVNRERIVVIETHQQRSKDEKKQAAQRPAVAIAPPGIRSELQWAAIGGVLLIAIQNLSEAILVVVKLLGE